VAGKTLCYIQTASEPCGFPGK